MEKTIVAPKIPQKIILPDGRSILKEIGRRPATFGCLLIDAASKSEQVRILKIAKAAPA